MSIFSKPKPSDPTKISSVIKNRVAEEAEKFQESLKNQILGEKSADSDQSIVDEIITDGGKISADLDDSQRKEISESDQRQLAQLEAELKKYRMGRGQAADQYSQKVQSEFDAGKKNETESPLVVPTSPKRGPKGPGHGQGKSKGSGEMLKAKK